MTSWWCVFRWSSPLKTCAHRVAVPTILCVTKWRALRRTISSGTGAFGIWTGSWSLWSKCTTRKILSWMTNRRRQPTDPLQKSYNAPVPYPTFHHFVTEMCRCLHISVTKWCIFGYLDNALWDLRNGSTNDSAVLWRKPNWVDGLNELKMIGKSIIQCSTHELLIFLYNNTMAQSLWDQHTGVERKNGSHFANHIFNCILFNENLILTTISLSFLPTGPIGNKPILV